MFILLYYKIKFNQKKKYLLISQHHLLILITF